MTKKSDALSALMDAAKRHHTSPEHREEQRRSFAYGITAFENPLITREMIDEEAERLAAEKNER